MTGDDLRSKCSNLASIRIRGELGEVIAAAIKDYSPKDLKRMQLNFSGKIKNINPLYRRQLEKTINGHMTETWEKVRLMSQQGAFSSIKEPLPEDTEKYWTMTGEKCSSGDPEKDRIRLLKYLLAGFCIFVQNIPPHPAGMPFPGGDKVQLIDGVYYCPVRDKAGDFDSALCPFCPAKQTPESGYLKPPVKASEHRKQEYLRNTFDFHHYNG
ncbi:MAG: DUF2115 domain-containing protein [Methanomicrobium sp.]|nr:DUF2115 domain-containing protein [Methanomicrobium sp.]